MPGQHVDQEMSLYSSRLPVIDDIPLGVAIIGVVVDEVPLGC
jgi:hypothetical protein